MILPEGAISSVEELAEYANSNVTLYAVFKPPHELYEKFEYLVVPFILYKNNLIRFSYTTHTLTPKLLLESMRVFSNYWLAYGYSKRCKKQSECS